MSTDEGSKKRGALNVARQMICENSSITEKGIAEKMEEDGYAISMASIKQVMRDTKLTLKMLKELGKLK